MTFLSSNMKKICVLTGAGISAESGISTFRDSNGLWENYAIEEVATPQAWITNKDLVQRFYNQRRKQVIEAAPNAAHQFLKSLEENFEVQIITQNIDDLHERAGSEHVLHLHGNIRLAKSSGPQSEKKYYPIDGWELRSDQFCIDGFPLRPHVVWFGEAVPELENAANHVSEADILIVIGTSLAVYPAASLVHFADKAVLKIVVDPKADELNIASDFVRIPTNAVESIESLKQLLTK